MADRSGPPSRRQWRYTWESLSHLPFLRLYLFDPSCPSAALPVSAVSAYLLHSRFLVVSISIAAPAAEAGDVSFRIPVPRGAVLDPSPAVECCLRGDYVEVKLPMLLSVDHPIVAASIGAGDDLAAPLSIKDDLTRLNSGNADLYCKSCSSKLTRKPLSGVVEMPSWNWRDIADNWFGTCCCSFGGASEKIVLKYLNSQNCSGRTNLLEAACLIVDKSLMLDNTSSQDASKVPDYESGLNYLCETAPSPPEECSSDESEHLLDATNSDAIYLNGKSNKQSENNHCREYEDDVKLDSCRCFSSEQTGNEELGCEMSCSHLQENKDILAPKSNSSLPDTISLGGGFLVRPSNILDKIQWVDYLCPHCSSPLGSFPSVDMKAPLDGCVRLFKFCASAYVAGDHYNIFRNHTLSKVFVNSLLENAEEDVSYRTVVKDFETKKNVLQIVLLSSNVWCCSRYCYENDEQDPTEGAALVPVVKVLFSDCSNASEAEQRLVDEWSSRNGAEEFYMMKSLSAELIAFLHSARSRMPLSCSTLQGMHLSYLER